MASTSSSNAPNYEFDHSIPLDSGERHDLQEVQCQANVPPLISSNQVCQFNYQPMNTSTMFNYSQSALQSYQAKQPAAVSKSPFEIKQGGDGKSCLPPPLDLCLVHKE